MSATLDTLQIVKRLKEAGFNDVQAEAVTNVVRDVRETDFGQLATKTDLDRLAVATRADFERLSSETKSDIERLRLEMAHFAAAGKAELAAAVAEVRADLVKWVVGIGFAQVATILGVLKLFPDWHP